MRFLVRSLVLSLYVAGVLAGNPVAKPGKAGAAKKVAGPGPSELELPPATKTVAALFKNGLAFISQSFELSGAGTYVSEAVPNPVHGTFWLNRTDVSARVSNRLKTVPMDFFDTSNVQQTLAGRQVRIRLKGDERTGSTVSALEGVTGVIADLNPKDKSRRSAASATKASSSYVNAYTSVGQSPPMLGGRCQEGGFLVLETDTGMLFLDPCTISGLQLTDKEALTKQLLVPTLALELNSSSTNSAKVGIQLSYLTKGCSWAPSYKITLLDQNRLVLEQAATIRNELPFALDKADTSLISGFPNVAFMDVESPITADWQSFMRSLNSHSGPSDIYSAATPYAGNVLSQVASNVASFGSAPSETPVLQAGDDIGVDVFYQPVGSLSLDIEESITRTVATSAATAVDSVVDWKIDDYDGQWDALEFSNPFTFPITTAPVSIYDRNGHFTGQSTIQWTDGKAKTTIRVNKAFSVKGNFQENQDPALDTRVTRNATTGQLVPVPTSPATSTMQAQQQQQQYQSYPMNAPYNPAPSPTSTSTQPVFSRKTYNGTVQVVNNRAQPITVKIQKRISGYMITSVGAEVAPGETTFSKLNPQVLLKWTLKVPAQANATATYSYHTLTELDAYGNVKYY